jgi:hypothetical protein
MATSRLVVRARRTVMPFARFRPLVLLLCLPACYTWRPIALTPARDLGPNARVRFERIDSTTAVFWGPRIVRDSVVAGSRDFPGRAAVAVADIRRAEEYRVSAARTSLAVVGVAAGVVAVLGAMYGLMVAGFSGVY